MQPPAAGGLGRHRDDKTHNHSQTSKHFLPPEPGPLPCKTSCGFPGQVNSGLHLHLPLYLLLSGQEKSPALNREIVIVIMIGILVRLALVTTLECFVFLKMTRRYKWAMPDANPVPQADAKSGRKTPYPWILGLALHSLPTSPKDIRSHPSAPPSPDADLGWLPNTFCICKLDTPHCCCPGFTLWLSGKESACNAEDVGLIPGSGRSPGEGNGHPLQYSCLGNLMDRGAWRATAHGVTKRWTRLSD